VDSILKLNRYFVLEAVIRYRKIAYLFVFLALQPFWLYFPQPRSGLEPPYSRGLLITHKDAPQSVGLLWTSDQSVTGICTWQHTTLTTDKHPCPR